MVARLTPDQKGACSNHVGVTNFFFFFSLSLSLSHSLPISNQVFFVCLFICLLLLSVSDLSSKRYFSCRNNSRPSLGFFFFVLQFAYSMHQKKRLACHECHNCALSSFTKWCEVYMHAHQCSVMLKNIQDHL